jgi:hypothetical protein
MAFVGAHPFEFAGSGHRKAFGHGFVRFQLWQGVTSIQILFGCFRFD